MSISPINFNGMIQNTSEAATSKAASDSKPQFEQAAVTIEISKHDEAVKKQVNNPDDARQQEYRYDREGNGKGYQGSQKKMLKKKSQEKKESDGRVVVKPMSSFDIKI